MEEHRRRIDALVADPDVAAKLKPYYRYLCKRPCFHDEYFDAFNRPNVTLIDCPAGIERITSTGPASRPRSPHCSAAPATTSSEGTARRSPKNGPTALPPCSG